MSILLVEDDEDDVVLTRALLDDTIYRVDWARGLDEVKAHLARSAHDVYLVDYGIGRHTGVEVAREILSAERHAAVIMLAAVQEREVDVRAAELGIVDYLVKGRLDSDSLERSLRYAISHQRTLRALSESEERYALALAGANDGLWDWDFKANRLYLSARWKQMLGYEACDLGDAPGEWFERIHPADRLRVEQAIGAHLDGRTAHFESEHRVRARDGRYRWMLARGLAVLGVDGTPSRIAGSQTDITARKKAESQLEHDALHDALSGLPNRVLFIDRLQHAMRRDIRRAGSEYTAVLFLDLDRFKIVNDSLGHLVGDRLLVEVARRLEGAVRPGDTVARMGGDEFAVLLEDLLEPDEAEHVAERILDTLTAPIMVEERELYLSASIGITLARAHADPGEVIRDADAAMYRAKAEGRGRHAMFDAALHEAAVERLELETRLRRGLATSQLNGIGLQVAYQPIVHAANGRLAGFEALARWRDSDGHVFGPDHFIPVAEETGLIHRLGRLVLREACARLAEWRRLPDSSLLTMSVNLSRRQLLDGAIIDELAQALDEYELPPGALRLEITETEAAADPVAIQRALEDMHERLGVRAHLDDFGTGASSLVFLRGFRGDALKIDRSFVQSMGSDKGAFQIVKAIVALAHNLGLEVVAEGVETTWQLKALRELHCQYAQGFLIARPVPDHHAQRIVLGEAPLIQSLAR